MEFRLPQEEFRLTQEELYLVIKYLLQNGYIRMSSNNFELDRLEDLLVGFNFLGEFTQKYSLTLFHKLLYELEQTVINIKRFKGEDKWGLN